MSQLIAVGYPDLATARDVARNLIEAEKGHDVELDDLVVIERTPDGKVKLHQPSTVAGGALGGAFWGGLLGLVFLVPFLGMAVGAATGAAAGAASDSGIDDQFMKDLGAGLDEGGAAVIVLVRSASSDKLLSRIEHRGKVIRTSLDDESERRLSEALGSAAG